MLFYDKYVLMTPILVPANCEYINQPWTYLQVTNKYIINVEILFYIMTNMYL